MKIITVANIKGGSAKSATSINLALELSKSEKVLVIDFDPQSSLTDFFERNTDISELQKANSAGNPVEIYLSK